MGEYVEDFEEMVMGVATSVPGQQSEDGVDNDANMMDTRFSKSCR